MLESRIKMVQEDASLNTQPARETAVAKARAILTQRGGVRRFARMALELANAHWRLRGCTLGPYVRVLGNPRIKKESGGVIAIGERVLIDSITARAELAVSPGGRLEIGSRTYINYGTSIAAQSLVRIGAQCHIGPYCNIADTDFHGIEDRHAPPPSAPVIIEEHVWLGAKAIILRGVTIGHDSVIGAGSVVTQNIPPRCVAAGNPARVIKTF